MPKDLEKSNEVKWHLQIIKNAVESYENDKHPIYFDYDGVIDLLKQAGMILTEYRRKYDKQAPGQADR